MAIQWAIMHSIGSNEWWLFLNTKCAIFFSYIMMKLEAQVSLYRSPDINKSS
jgi:hypothetical protein